VPDTRLLPTYCYNCVAGPDLMKVKVEDGVATEVQPNCDAAGIHPANGRVCVKAYGHVQKVYNPGRIKTPMKRTNPKKGRNEDPGFVPISWDEALDTITQKLSKVKQQGLKDEAGLPRVAVSFGHGGTPASYMGTLPAFLASWGPIDFSFGSGQGVKCVHSEHLYGEYWHRGFTVCADTVNTNYVVSFGANLDSSGGPCATWRHAAARARGCKRVQVEPHLSVTGGTSAEWVPIKPKTDMAFMFAMLHVMLFENARTALDLPFLKDRTAAPYLVGPEGYYLRHPESGKPLIWDLLSATAVAHDTPDIDAAIDGTFEVIKAYEQGPDDERFEYQMVKGNTSFTEMNDIISNYTPEWAQSVCDVPASTIRRVASEFLQHACVGETVEVDGETLPFRPVAIALGKTVNNGWGAYQCCWARTVMATLVGALEVPGGTIGTTVRLNRPLGNRLASVKPGEDGFMAASLNPTDRDNWHDIPVGRNAHSTLVPLLGNNGAWSQALGPSHLAWMFLDDAPEGWERNSYPDIWFIYRSNPAISFWDSNQMTEIVAKMPFTVAFAYTPDETNHMADILLPDATDFESTQLIQIGGTKFVEQVWKHQGVALRQAVVEPQHEARDMSWIATELAKRNGLLRQFNQALNKGAGGISLKGEGYDFSLDVDQEHSPDAVWDAACKAATSFFSKGKEVHDLQWFKEHGFYVVPYKREDWYLYPTMVKQNLRFELPYQERLIRVGEELKRRMHEKGSHWWDLQLTEYEAIPSWHDVPTHYEKALVNMGGKPEDFPFWGITTKSAQYAAGSNISIQLMDDVGRNVRGHGSIILNAGVAKQMGIERGDRIEIRSLVGTTSGRAEPVQGIRPDTICIPGQFDAWATPYAKDLDFPSLNTIMPLSIELTDGTGSGADLVRVSIRRLEAVA